MGLKNVLSLYKQRRQRISYLPPSIFKRAVTASITALPLALEATSTDGSWFYQETIEERASEEM